MRERGRTYSGLDYATEGTGKVGDTALNITYHDDGGEYGDLRGRGGVGVDLDGHSRARIAIGRIRLRAHVG